MKARYTLKAPDGGFDAFYFDGTNIMELIAFVEEKTEFPVFNIHKKDDKYRVDVSYGEEGREKRRWMVADGMYLYEQEGELCVLTRGHFEEHYRLLNQTTWTPVSSGGVTYIDMSEHVTHTGSMDDISVVTVPFRV